MTGMWGGIFRGIWDQTWRSGVLLAIFTVLLGFVYPGLATVIAVEIFPQQSCGSGISAGGRRVGSGLVGQDFKSPGYFWPRLSSTSPYPYNPALSSGSNAGPLNSGLLSSAQARADLLRSSGGANVVPLDLITSSASGLDPHISPAAAKYQVSRIARVRNISAEKVLDLVVRHIEHPCLGFIGAPRVNVLLLNLDLDALTRDIHVEIR